MTDFALPLSGWLAFVKSLSADQGPERLEALLAGQRAVFDHALRQSGRSLEADRLKGAGAELGLPEVSISALARVADDLLASRTEGLQRNLPLNAMLAADIGEAALLLRSESGLATSSQAQALVMRVETLLDAVATRATETLGQLDDAVRSFADPNSESARFLADQIAGWRADLADLNRIRRFSADLSLTNARLETLRQVEPVVGKLYQAGLLNDTGRRARLKQAADLLAQGAAALVGEATSAPLQSFDLASVVDPWQPRPADAAASSARYLADMKRRSSLLTSPPGRIWDRRERFDAMAALEEVQWLIRAGRPEEGERSLRTALPHLHKTERTDIRWISAAADLGLSGLAADMAIAGLAAANGSENSMDRYIDRVALIAARCETPEFIERIEADPGKDPERACAAAFLLAVKGRSRKALTLIGGTESVRGPVFFRLARAYLTSTPATDIEGRVMATDRAAAAWLAGLSDGDSRSVSLLEWGSATPGDEARRTARTGMAAVTKLLDACDIPLVPEVEDGSLEAELAGLIEGVLGAWSTPPSPDPCCVALGVDRFDDVLALAACRGVAMPVLGVGASPARLERLQFASTGREPTPVRFDRRRRMRMGASYEAFLAGLGAPRAPDMPRPVTEVLGPSGWWARQAAEAGALAAVDPIGPGAYRATLRALIVTSLTRALLRSYTACIVSADGPRGFGTRRVSYAGPPQRPVVPKRA